MHKAITTFVGLLFIASVAACTPPPLQNKNDKVGAALADPQASFL